MVTRVLATTHEISLKGGNRRWFERKLTANVRRALSDLPVARVERPAWRVLVTFSEEVPFEEAARRLGTVFGLHAIMPVEHAGFTLESVADFLTQHLEAKPARSFAVRCTRSDKSFPMTSVEIEREVGAIIQGHTGWPVNLESPQLLIRLLLDENGFFFWFRRALGPGGLPIGSGGRAACLLSGGIDSPVAAYYLMKRGMRLEFVHFHSVPRTDPASLEKVLDLVKVLNRYQISARVAMVPLLEIQEQIVAFCPAELRVLLYRRFMFRLAERLAGRLRCRALVTGESLGQVASQTIENLGAVGAVTSIPVLRPLIGLDKQEIIAIARRAGSYEISIQPHFDCCSFFVPERPATRATSSQLADAEAVLHTDALVKAALESTTIERINDAVPWQEIPLPAGVGG
jgi:thiamine biosynthesis protein ThiI